MAIEKKQLRGRNIVPVSDVRPCITGEMAGQRSCGLEGFGRVGAGNRAWWVREIELLIAGKGSLEFRMESCISLNERLNSDGIKLPVGDSHIPSHPPSSLARIPVGYHRIHIYLGYMASILRVFIIYKSHLIPSNFTKAAIAAVKPPR
jgi:hypothetical protein